MTLAPAEATPPPLEAPPASPGAWAPLARPAFRAIWLGGLASNVGTWMQNVGAAWLMTSLAPTPLLVALVQAASTFPSFRIGWPASSTDQTPIVCIKRNGSSETLLPFDLYDRI